MLSVTYLSSARPELDEAELLGILEVSRERNAACGVTGLLLYRDGNIIQTVEGPREAVEDTFARIERDPRHRGIIVLLREQVTERAFPDWAMGFRRTAAATVAREHGFSDYLDATDRVDDGRRAERAEEPAATQLHATFRESVR